MAWTKYIIVVDDDVNVHDEEAVLRAMLERCHFARDVEIVNGPLDILDHASPRLGAGHKMGFDATRKIQGEEVNGIPIDASAPIQRGGRPSDFNRANHVNLHVPAFSHGRGVFISVEKKQAGDGARAIQELWSRFGDHSPDFIIAVDSSVNCSNWQEVMFHWCANTDPGRDLHRCDHRIAFDATAKLPGDERNGQPVRDYPPILRMTEEVKRRIDQLHSNVLSG